MNAPKRAPLPSKDAILEFIRDSDAPVGKREIARAFHIRGDDRIALKRRLQEMADEGLIGGGPRKSRLSPRNVIPRVAVLDMTELDADGELLARPMKWGAEHAPPRIRMTADPGAGPALGPGDRALCRIEPDGEDGYRARPIKKLDSRTRRVVGVFRKTRTGGRVEPIDKRGRGDDILIDGKSAEGAETGDVVAVDLAPGRGGGLPRGAVTDIVGRGDAPQTFSLIACHEHGIHLAFPEDAIAAAEAAEAPALESYREDLRETPLITIDPADARDHDDAVWAAADDDGRNAGGWRVLVAIADVAHYVRHGDPIDREARRRGNSTYLPDRVAPMLPERLSNGLCSLKASEERACLFVEMRFNPNGQKVRHRFGRGLMRAIANLSYEQAQAAADGAPDEDAAPLNETVIQPLFAAYRALAAARAKRGPLELELPEHKVMLDPEGWPIGAVRRARFDAHKLIEELMIQANVCAAETLEERRTPLIYRVHDAPSEDKLEALIDYMESLGFSAPKGQRWTPSKLNQLVDAARADERDGMVQDAVLRAQSQAVYATENLGHFGLNLRRYAHFTSPIRRYADLIVHRALVRAGAFGPGGLRDEEIADLDGIAQHVSGAERASMAAERDATDRFLSAYLADKVGGAFPGRIAGVTRSGLFVKLEETGADGFVPVSTLGGDYWVHDPSTHMLIGSSSGDRYRLGQTVEVRLEEAAPLAGGLRFAMLSEPEPGPKPSNRMKTDRRRGRERSRRR